MRNRWWLHRNVCLITMCTCSRNNNPLSLSGSAKLGTCVPTHTHTHMYLIISIRGFFFLLYFENVHICPCQQIYWLLSSSSYLYLNLSLSERPMWFLTSHLSRLPPTTYPIDSHTISVLFNIVSFHSCYYFPSLRSHITTGARPTSTMYLQMYGAGSRGSIGKPSKLFQWLRLKLFSKLLF